MNPVLAVYHQVCAGHDPEAAADTLIPITRWQLCSGMFSLPKHGNWLKTAWLVARLMWSWNGLGPQGRRLIYFAFLLGVFWGEKASRERDVTARP